MFVQRQPRRRVRTLGRRALGRRALGRPPGAVSDATRARIIGAACHCFAEQGYAKTSNRDIARRAGLTTGALYHYFSSKAALFAAAHRHAQQALLQVYQQAFAQEATCVAQICAGLDGALAIARRQPQLVHFASTAALEIDRHPELRAVLQRDTQGARHFFARLVAAARARGEIAAGIDDRAVVNVMVSSLFGLAWLRSQLRSASAYEASARAFQRLLRGALFYEPAAMPRRT